MNYYWQPKHPRLVQFLMLLCAVFYAVLLVMAGGER